MKANVSNRVRWQLIVLIGLTFIADFIAILVIATSRFIPQPIIYFSGRLPAGKPS
jgi:hypothetical protein